MTVPRESVVTFAASVVELELAADPSDPAGVVERVALKLHDALGKLVGSAGFDALLSRAMVLARRACPTLAEVRVLPAGGVEGFREATAGQEQATILAAAEALLAHFVELLLVLIGEDLGMRLVRMPWHVSSGPSTRKARR